MARSILNKGFSPSGIEESIADLSILSRKGEDRGKQGKKEKNNPTAPKKELSQPPTPADNIGVFDSLWDIPKSERKGKTAGFYLSNEVLEVIDKIATQRKVSQSKVIDTALRQVLKIQ